MKILTYLLFAISFSGCAIPAKPLIIAEGRKPSPVVQTTATRRSTAPASPISRDDGLRLPDMLVLPKDERLRSSAAPEDSGDGRVITRPPEE